MSQFQKARNRNLKEKALTYLGGKKCFKCGVEYLPSVCYDFHHNKGAKEEEISKMIQRNVPWTILKKELDKCKIVCKNCHAIIHHTH